MKFNRILFCCAVLFVVLFSHFFCYAEDFILHEGFSYEDIPAEIQNFMAKNSYKENEYVKFEDLKLCKVLYFGFDGKEHEGELVVAHKVNSPIDGETVNVAKEVLEIFYELYEAKYPICKMRLIDYYGADDELSMKDNNSSAFNFRYINGTRNISWHSYGLAIDINPFVNPCFSPNSNITEPDGAEKFLNRNLEQLGIIKEGDACHKAFTSRGWDWGGSWNCPIDYMHFQKYPWYVSRPNPKYLITHLS